jgi:peptidoglycan/xylan/chitin deacetylase (PgdA/CDA1 family)
MCPIALTFDDGPHPEWTPEILRVLDTERPVKATFFVWGEQALRHAEIVVEVLAAGHAVQPHCWQHRSHLDLTPAEISADIQQVVSLLRGVGAAAPHLWRPPWGQLQQGATKAIARQRGLELAGWNVDSGDWDGRPAAQMYENIKPQILAHQTKQPVVIMHDSCVEPGQAERRSHCGRRLTR